MMVEFGADTLSTLYILADNFTTEIQTKGVHIQDEESREDWSYGAESGSNNVSSDNHATLQKWTLLSSQESSTRLTYRTCIGNLPLRGEEYSVL